MKELEWISLPLVIAVHDEQLSIHGGSSGLRDAALLESALGRPQNKWAYENAELPELAAAYGFGIARNHPFVDGNKRTALAAIIVFLGLNRIDLDAPQEAATAIILSLAAGEIAEDVLARWIAAHVRPLIAPGIVP